MEEVEEGFSDLYYRQNNEIWRYALHTNDKQVKNITVLFRGSPDEILSHFKYGALLVNGRVIDLLKNVDDDDPRVQGFDVKLPFTKGLDINIVLTFTYHEYAESKIRILADVGPPEDGNVSAYGTITDGVVEGDLWDSSWAPKKVHFQDDIDEVVSKIDMSQLKREFEQRQAEIILGVEPTTLASRLNEFVAWKAQRKAIDDRLNAISHS
jgi:hypothetical protein